MANPMARIDRVLGKARRGLKGLTPEQAAAEHGRGALLVDTRTSEQRSRDGEIPGAVAIDRTVFEWRLDPTSPAHIAEAAASELSHRHLRRALLIEPRGRLSP